MEEGIKAEQDETKMDCAGLLSFGAAVAEEAAGDSADGNANKVAYKGDSSANITAASSVLPDGTGGPDEAESPPKREANETKAKEGAIKPAIGGSLEEFIRADELLVDDKDTCNTAKLEDLKQTKRKHWAIWVSNINPETKASSLKVELSKYGKVMTARIVTNGEKYFGCALLETQESAKLCFEKLNHKMLNGFEVEISFDPPAKKKVEHEKKELKHISKRRRRSVSNDPLTLKVSSSRSREKRSRSTSRRRKLSRDIEYNENRQREVELRLAIERRKLAKEKRQLEHDKLEFLKFQKRIQQETVNEQVKKEVRRLEQQRRTKDDEYFRSKTLVDKVKRRYATPSPSRKIYREVKRREEKVPPPPPRLSHEDLERRDWSKPKLENAHDYKYESVRKSDYRQGYHTEGHHSDRKPRYSYPEAKHVEDKYKDKKDSGCKDVSCKTIRSEVFVAAAPRSNFQYATGSGNGSGNISYPAANRSYNPQQPPPVEYYPPPQHITVPHTQNNWTDRYKDYTPSGNRSVHIEHKYDDYSKRQPYFSTGRKY